MSQPAGHSQQIDENRLRILFALLFSSPEAVTLDRIREVLHGEGRAAADAGDGPAGAASESEEEVFSPRDYLKGLEEWMAARQLPLVLHQVGKAFRLLTSEEVAADLESVRQKAHKERIGPAALEVLALVAYRQPVLKADIDAIRGVQSGPHLRHLLDLRMVRILGRAELPGRPFLYGTTREFLDRFGLRDLKDLPQSERLAIPAEAPPQAAEAPPRPGEPAEAPPDLPTDAPSDAAVEGSQAADPA